MDGKVCHWGCTLTCTDMYPHPDTRVQITDKHAHVPTPRYRSTDHTQTCTCTHTQIQEHRSHTDMHMYMYTHPDTGAQMTHKITDIQQKINNSWWNFTVSCCGSLLVEIYIFIITFMLLIMNIYYMAYNTMVMVRITYFTLLLIQINSIIQENTDNLIAYISAPVLSLFPLFLLNGTL